MNDSETLYLMRLQRGILHYKNSRIMRYTVLVYLKDARSVQFLIHLQSVTTFAIRLVCKIN